MTRPTKNALEKLQNWYEAECNGDWEHQYGVRIHTLDNPGWAVDIDLWDTTLANRPFEDVTIDRTESDWVRCKVERSVFTGRGGATNLNEILRLFLTWADGE